MFKFDFNVEGEEESNSPFKVQKEAEGEKIINSPAPITCHESLECLPTEDTKKNFDVVELNSVEKTFGDISLKHVASGYLLKDNSVDESTVVAAEQIHSDLIPGVYEGGAKIWECTDDLLTYLSESCPIDLWKGKQTLDLGCGAGLLGLFAYKNGANVHFQDYNKDVLENITIPNVLLNVLNEDEVGKAIKFYSGDWSNYTELTKDDEKFDIILTAETIYNPQNQQKLLDTFHAKLKPDGTVFLAAKTYYFGVGGGLRQFEDLIASDKRFQTKVLWCAIKGVGREILEIKHL